MAIFTPFLCVMMLVSTSLSAVSPAKETKLKTALKEVTVDTEQEYECLLFRLEDKLDKIERKIAEIEIELGKEETSLKTGRKGGKSAFSAYMSDSNALRTGGTLMFTKVISNDGKGYNEHTGAFTAKANGVYVFHFHASTYSYSKHCSLSLLHQNQTVTSSYDYDRYGFSLLSNSVVLDLKKTDVVQVSVTSLASTSYCYLRGKQTTFSGYML